MDHVSDCLDAVRAYETKLTKRMSRDQYCVYLTERIDDSEQWRKSLKRLGGGMGPIGSDAAETGHNASCLRAAAEVRLAMRPEVLEGGTYPICPDAADTSHSASCLRAAAEGRLAMRPEVLPPGSRP